METFTTVNREFIEKCLIALRETPAPLADAIARKKKMTVIVKYDPEKPYIRTDFIEGDTPDQPGYQEQKQQEPHLQTS